MRIGFVIPALDEEECVARAIENCRAALRPDDEVRIVVCDNSSRDNTAERARAANAEVVVEVRRGYGAACLKALNHLGDWPEIICFSDADCTTSNADIARVVDALRDKSIDLAMGARRTIDKNSMSLPQRFGTGLATFLIRLLWRRKYQDLGPTRAIRLEALKRLQMQDTTWGWTVEMQIKAIGAKLNVVEVPVTWLCRPAGQSKISGTITGVLRAGSKIIWTIFSLYLSSFSPAN